MGVLRFVTDVNGAVGNIDGQNRDELLKVLLPQVQLIPSLAGTGLCIFSVTHLECIK